MTCRAGAATYYLWAAGLLEPAVKATRRWIGRQIEPLARSGRRRGEIRVHGVKGGSGRPVLNGPQAALPGQHEMRPKLAGHPVASVAGEAA